MKWKFENWHCELRGCHRFFGQCWRQQEAEAVRPDDWDLTDFPTEVKVHFWKKNRFRIKALTQIPVIWDRSITTWKRWGGWVGGPYNAQCPTVTIELLLILYRFGGHFYIHVHKYLISTIYLKDIGIFSHLSPQLNLF